MRSMSLTVALLAVAGLLSWTGLSVVANATITPMHTPPAKASPAPQQPSVVAVQKFGVWEIRCLKVPPPAGVSAKSGATPKSQSDAIPTRVYAGVTIATTFTCRAVAETHYNNNPLLGVRLVFLLVPQPPAIKLLAVFPPRFTLSALKGPRLKLDAAVLTLHPYSHCDPLECGASVQLSPARLGEFRKAKSIVLELPDLQNTKPFEYAIPAAGLSEAIDVLLKLAPK